MSLKIKRQSDTRVVHACTHNLADIPNGVTVCSNELVPGTPLKEGSAIAPGSDGLYHVIKTASVAEAVTATGKTVKVEKGSHFKAGDAVMFGGVAAKINRVDRDGLTYDTITLAAALGALAKGDVLTLAAAAASADAQPAYKAKALTGDHYDVKELENHLVSAVTIGQFKESVIPPITDAIKEQVRGIQFI